jgi:cytochrome bd-type quinol oxidase subunit 2
MCNKLKGNALMDIGILGVLAVMLCPMIFGGITFHYSHKFTHPVTQETWKYWEDKDVG